MTLATRVRPLLRRVKRFFTKNPEGYVGGVLVNTLGYQVVRVLWINAIRSLRRIRPSPEAERIVHSLRRDGVIVIPDFLDPAVFAEIKNEFERVKATVPFCPVLAAGLEHVRSPEDAGISYAAIRQNERAPSYEQLFSLLDTHIRENPLIRDVASAILRTNVPFFYPFEIFIHKKTSAKPDLDSNSYFHPDVPFPGIKAFLYLNEIDADNAAFRYVPGSHRLTLKRLRFEYLKSIRVACDKRDREDPRLKSTLEGRQWHCLSREEEKEFDVRGVSQNGKAGSLLMFNVMGFHRRGEFAGDQPRELAATGYRR